MITRKNTSAILVSDREAAELNDALSVAINVMEWDKEQAEAAGDAKPRVRQCSVAINRLKAFREALT